MDEEFDYAETMIEQIGQDAWNRIIVTPEHFEAKKRMVGDLDENEHKAWIINKFLVRFKNLGAKIEVHEDGYVSIFMPEEDDVIDIHHLGMHHSPLMFREVKGNFRISGSFGENNEGHSDLITLKGCPQKVTGSFDCSGNRDLKTLVGGPQIVTKDYNCSNTSITNFEGTPKQIGGIFSFDNVKVADLEGIPAAENYRSTGKWNSESIKNYVKNMGAAKAINPEKYKSEGSKEMASTFKDFFKQQATNVDDEDED